MGVQEKDPLAQLRLPPGFRFYPTDEELMVQYLCRKVAGHQFNLQIIAEIDLYKFEPWILPSKATFGEKEWYFFSPRDRKYPNGSRPNRVAGSGYWKATGTDKVITTKGKKVGIKKALVFYVGKAPKGTKTNWIMHEYRLSEPTRINGSSKLDEWVLCRLYKKNSGAAKPTVVSKEEPTMDDGSSPSSSSHLDHVLDSLPEIDHRSFSLPRVNSFKNLGPQPEDNNKSPLQRLGSGSFDWAVLAGLTSVPELGVTGLTQPQPQMNNHYYHAASDVYSSLLPPLSHVESPVENNKFVNSGVLMMLDEEVQSGIRTQRVNQTSPSYFTPNSNVLTRNYSNSVDPFRIRYESQQSEYGFGFRQ